MKTLKQMLKESENKYLDKMLTLDSVDRNILNRNFDKKTLRSLDFYLNNIEANFNFLLSYQAVLDWNNRNLAANQY